MRLFLFTTTWLFSTLLFCQEKTFPIESIEIQTGFITYNPINIFQDDIDKFLPNSEVSQKDFSQYSSYDYWDNSESYQFAFLVHLHQKTIRKIAYRFKFGTHFSQSAPISFEKHKQNTFAFDTLNSSKNGETYYLDSVINESYTFLNQGNNMGLVAELELSNTKIKAWKWSAGLGLNFGLSLNNKSELKYKEERYTAIKPKGEDNYISSYNYQPAKTISKKDAPNAFYANLYFPLSLDYQLSMSKPFWNRIKLGYVIRPGIYWFSIANTGNYSTGNFGSTFNIKVRL